MNFSDLLIMLENRNNWELKKRYVCPNCFHLGDYMNVEYKALMQGTYIVSDDEYDDFEEYDNWDWSYYCTDCGEEISPYNYDVFVDEIDRVIVIIPGTYWDAYPNELVEMFNSWTVINSKGEVISEGQEAGEDFEVKDFWVEV